MKMRILAILGTLACAGVVAAPALANDGGGEPAKNEPAAKKDEKPAGDASKECKDAPKDAPCEGAGAAKKATSPCGEGSACRPDCEGPADGSDLCKEGTAKRNALFVTLSALVGDGEAGKKVLGAVPAESAKKVEEARKAAFESVVKIRREVVGIQKEIETLCAQAKADGKVVCQEAVDALGNDAETLMKKCHESMNAFTKLLGETLGAEKVQALAAEVQKSGDVAKAFTAKVDAAVKAAGEAAKVKAGKAKCDDDDADEDDDDEDEDDDDGPPCKDGKCEKAEKGEKVK
jgi:hypothetical protein